MQLHLLLIHPRPLLYFLKHYVPSPSSPGCLILSQSPSPSIVSTPSPCHTSASAAAPPVPDDSSSCSSPTMRPRKKQALAIVQYEHINFLRVFVYVRCILLSCLKCIHTVHHCLQTSAANAFSVNTCVPVANNSSQVSK